jgi:hypothetical protein
MATEILHQEVVSLRGEGYSVEIVEAEGVVNLVFENYFLPPIYNKPSTILLLRIPESYPNGNPDMFWTETDLLCVNGQIPNTAETIETHLGKQWRRFSWHPQGWNPGIGNLSMYLEFVNSGFQKAGKRQK